MQERELGGSGLRRRELGDPRLEQRDHDNLRLMGKPQLQVVRRDSEISVSKSNQNEPQLSWIAWIEISILQNFLSNVYLYFCPFQNKIPQIRGETRILGVG